MKRASAGMVALFWALGHSPLATAATSNWTGPGSDFNGAANWDSGVPVDNAGFNTALPGSISVSANRTVNSLTFNSGASAYTITNSNNATFTLAGAGIVNNSGVAQSLVNTSATLVFDASSTAADSRIANQGSGVVVFTNSSTPGHATIDNQVGTLLFRFSSSASNATILNSSTTIIGSGFIGLSYATAGNATIVNDGNLRFASAGTAGAATITNNGLVSFSESSNGGAATITNNASAALQLFSGTTLSTSTITNSGIVTLNDTSSAWNATITNNTDGIVQLNDTATLGNATFTNNGVTVAASGSATRWSVGSLAGSGTLDLRSTNLSVGSNQLSTTFSGILSGKGGMSKVGTGTLTLTGANTYTGATTVEAGTLHLTGSLASAVTVGGAGTLTGTGTLGALVNQGTVAPGVSGIGTLSASVYSGTGTVNIGFDGVSHGALRISGSANVSGETLNVTGTHFAVGRYSVLRASALTGTFASFNDPGVSVLTFTPEYTATDAYVLVRFSTPFVPFAHSANQSSVAAYLDIPKDTSTENFTTAITRIALLPVAQIPQAYTQISGDALASFQDIHLHNAGVFMQGMRQRAVSVSSGTYGFWGQGLGWTDSMKSDASLGSPSFAATTGGFQSGYDLFLNDAIGVGFSGGYANTSVDVPDRASAGHVKSIVSGFYASYNREDWFVNGSAAFISEANDMSRSIRYSGVQEQATTTFNSRHVATMLEAGRSFRRGETLTLVPAISLRQDHARQDGFTESGAPGVGLTVGDRALDSTLSSLGVGLQRHFFPRSGHALVMSVNTAWEHEWGSTRNALAAHFTEASGGSDFTVEGTPRSRNAVAIGFGGRMPLRENLELLANYSATLSPAKSGHKMEGGLRLKW